MFNCVRHRYATSLANYRHGAGWGQTCKFAVFLTPEELEQPSTASNMPHYTEPIQEPLVGTLVREHLSQELTELCNNPPFVSATVGANRFDYGKALVQAMPFQHSQAAAYFYHSQLATVKLATQIATCCQRHWERRAVDERCHLLEKTADLIAGRYRQHIAAAAMVGQGMTAIEAELNICQLVDYIRSGCVFMRDLTKCPYVADGGVEAHNRNQYHGLEGFWAAITPCDSFSLASQLAIIPLITGNSVVWKPSDRALLACQRVFECLQMAGVPAGVINFVPAEENTFLDIVCSSKSLAGISFAGSTSTLEHIWRTVGYRIADYTQFPRIVGTGSGKNFHVVHSSANLANAVACTVRAAFDMAGQKALSCSRVFVARSVLDQFMTMLQTVTKSLFVCHPLDYRCFTSSLISEKAYDKVVDIMRRAETDQKVELVTGGRYDKSVGYYVEPTVYLVGDPQHELMCREVRGPLLAVCPCPDQEPQWLERAVSQSPYAICGSIFAQEAEWSRWALGALRDAAPTLLVNARCSEERPAQLGVGGARKSGSGAKAGSLSYLLHFSAERSVREALCPAEVVEQRYMLEAPPCVLK